MTGYMDEFFDSDDSVSIHRFNAMLSEFYLKNRRPMPWRDEITPYRVVVSEIMLQQTQVPRVLKKFEEFMQIFPDFAALAQASLEDVLRVWQGLGYNRRAKYLLQISQEIMNRWDGVVPDDPAVLQTLPGIGAATAGSIVVFAYDRPVVFIETNVRRVFIHHFFQDRGSVSDKEIYPVLNRTLDHTHPRDWYYSIMDYGTYLAGAIENPNRRSRHYAVQSKFSGSDREIRGRILKILLDEGPTAVDIIHQKIQSEKERTDRILGQMIHEGLLMRDGSLIRFLDSKDFFL
ncbi:A/G-specific adenine glycosylase [Methanospirillum purgamenti]|uniref:A/G-specific adenine glycosylase n=2 Tax=Methanospirillum TaxID=2202 RepID=A0A8F5VRN7_METHU|nr:A/G-specific adenine glycosylase [Methanospirillum hungatei]